MARDYPAGLRVEFRCPEFSESGRGVAHAGQLFAVLTVDRFLPGDSGFIEIACQRCKQREIRAGRSVHRIIHRYYLDGKIAETLEEPVRTR